MMGRARQTAIFTIVAKNYLPYARVLMRSAAMIHPEWRRYVVLVDHVDGYFDPLAEDFEIVLSGDLPISGSRWFHFKYAIMELSTAVKPYAFEYLFSARGFDQIVYLDPDIRIYSPLHRITEVLETASVALTPHLTGSLDDDRRPAEIDILRAGTYNLGFIAVARSRETAAFLAWWQQRLYDHCVVDLPRGLFVDQKWVDLAPGMFEGVAIIRDPGYNVAYWNLGHRILADSETGYEVGGRPLAFFHFSGFDAEQPDRLSCHQNRFKVAELPGATQRLLVAYSKELLEAGYLTCRKWPYAFGFFQNGIRIPDTGRPIHHEDPELTKAITDPFSDEGFEAFLKVWNGPVQDDDGAFSGISRLAYRIYRTRTDVQSAMPDIFGGHYKRFLEWMLVSGRVEHGLGDEFLSTISDAIRVCKDHQSARAWPETAAPDEISNELIGDPATFASGGPRLRLTRLAMAIYQSRPELQRFFPDPCGRDSARFLVWLLTYGKKEHHLSAHHTAPMKAQWRSVAGAQAGWLTRLRYELILRGMAASVYVRGSWSRLPLVRARLKRLRPRFDIAPAGNGKAAVAEPAPPRQFGVNLVGYFYSETGVGQSARAARAALQAAPVPVSLRCVSDSGPSRKQDHSAGPMSEAFPYAVNLFYVNADQTSIVADSLGGAFYRHRHNIGYWVWELEDFPECWLSAFRPYQEVWTPSNFCRNAVARKASVPVHCFPYAVAPAVPAGMDRQYFGLAPDRFLFLTAFDVLSVMERKNPLGTIRAFERAFAGNSRSQLVIKVNNAEARPKCIETLRSACTSGSVRILDSTVTREEMYALTQCADCVVSLHRSEGFGLLIAEAMYLGKPVIVTNYSGNTDFTLPDNSLLVDYKMIPVGANCAPYDPASLWADPDVDLAGAHMANVVQDAELRARLSHAGQAFVKATLSPDAVGRAMRQRLEALRGVNGQASM
jgi:glycosyltransferase involved in cell wall biosynthesis